MEIGLYLYLAVVARLAYAKRFSMVYGNLAPGKTMELEPVLGATLNRWVLTTCDSCKITVNCTFLEQRCTDKLTISDGKNTYSYIGCIPQIGIDHSSHSNSIKVTMETSSDHSSSLCKATASRAKQPGHESCKCGWTNKPENRIVRGKEAGLNEFPFVVFVRLENSTHTSRCGGSIISNKHVLTAAHCTWKIPINQITVFTGVHDIELLHLGIATVEQKIGVKTVYHHEQYVDEKLENDIAVLELEENIEFSRIVGPVCLPSSPPDILGQHITVMGWGWTKTNGKASDVLLKVDLKVKNWNKCRNAFHISRELKQTQVCTWSPGKDTCQGDSGGPLVLWDSHTDRYTQVALVSYGEECASTTPGINTDVYHYMDWINRKIRDSGEAVCMA